MSPVGDATPPSGSTDTAIPAGVGRDTGVSNTTEVPPDASGRKMPALIGAPLVRTYNW